MDAPGCEIGIVGLGVMGRNLLLNVAEHGYPAAGYDRDLTKVDTLQPSPEAARIYGAESAKDLVQRLRRPRAIVLLVPAGRAVDGAIEELLPFLEAGDVIVDGGNSHYKDTDLRMEAVAPKGILYVGMGISGGEHGARFGPSLMPGGPREGYDRVRPVLEAVAAKAGGEPCVAWLGPGSAGHYVKMVHNGIEYGLMRLIAETYDFLRRGLGLADDELAAVFQRWNEGELNAYLVEITASIFRKEDERTGRPLVEMILDEARQKGTGMWMSQDALVLGVPVPTIDVAVSMRHLSVFKDEREAASRVFSRPIPAFEGDRQVFLDRHKNALYAAMIVTYAQGMAQLRQAADAYGYQFALEDVARIWRGGCIIRAALLERIRAAYRARPDLPNLMVDPPMSREIAARQEDLRTVVKAAAAMGIPAPGLMVSLGYFDAYRSARLPANLIEAQRDYFGAHTYERVDVPGVFHTQWDVVQRS